MTTRLPLGVVRGGRDPAEGTPTFLLLHGFGASSFTWRHWLPELERRGHVVRVDLKGFGTAPPTEDHRFGPQHQADLVHRLIQEEDLRRVTLVGHSLGGGISLLTALRLLDGGPDQADRLARMVLVSSAAYHQKAPPFVTMGRWPVLSELVVRLIGASRLIRWTLRTVVHDPERITAGQIAGYAGPLNEPGSRRAILRAATQVFPPDLAQVVLRYREITVPTLLLWGREDPVTPLWIAERLLLELPRARLEILEGCGHAPPEELPTESLARVTRFLDESR